MYKAVVVTFLLVSVGCASPRVCGFKEKDIVQWFIPASGGSERTPVPCDRVAFLDAPPTNRNYRVLGWVSPPAGAFRSWGEAINATRAAASLHGADAVFIVDQKEIEFSGWGFSAGGGFASGGHRKGKTVQFWAKVIAWE